VYKILKQAILTNIGENMSDEIDAKTGRFLPSKKYNQDLDSKEIVRLYIEEERSTNYISKKMNSYPRKIRKTLIAEGVKFRDKKCYLIGKDNPKFTGYEEIQGSFLASIKAGAKKRGIKFEVPKEYLWNLFIQQKRKCAYTGIEIFFSRNNAEFSMGRGNASLDRIDSSLGYTEGNLQWVHKRINIMKGNMDDQEFLDFCEAVTYQNKGQEIHKTLTHTNRNR
jgi:hypothetical protein